MSEEAFLARALGPDVASWSELVQLRREHRRGPAGRAGVGRALRRAGSALERQEAEARLAGLRESFDERDSDELAEEALSLELDDFPDLARSRDRLVHAAEALQQFHHAVTEDLHATLTVAFFNKVNDMFRCNSHRI